MKFFLVIMLFISQAHAQRSLTRESFLVNIRPVLNGILNDFYQMVALFPDFPQEIIPLVQELDTITNDKEQLKETCPRVVEKSCAKTIESIRKKLSSIRLISLKLLSKHKMSSALYVNSMAGQRVVTQFDSEVEEIKSYLDNASFLLTAGIRQKRETYYILKELDELNTLMSLALVEYIPYMYKDDFRHFYFNFVGPIQLQISKNKNYEFLNRNVNSLNFAINLLNMNLTKRKKTPEGMGPYLSVIHNRWNSLLRYYF